MTRLDLDEPTYLTDPATRWAVWGNPEDPEDRGRCVLLDHAEPLESLLEPGWCKLYCMTGTYNEAMQKYYDVEDLGIYVPME